MRPGAHITIADELVKRKRHRNTTTLPKRSFFFPCEV